MALIAAYSFDEPGDTVVDQTGNGHDFSLSGQPVTRTMNGHTNGGLTSGSANAGAAVATPPFGETANRTVMLWQLGDGEVWSIRWHVSAIDSGAWGILTIGGQIGPQARNSSGAVSPRVALPADAATVWHHYAAVYDETAGEVRFYIDGTLASSSLITGPLRTDADFLDVCEWGDSSVIDDVRIYDEALDQAAIAALMDQPVIPPASSGEAECRYWNGTSWAASIQPRIYDGSSFTVAPFPRFLS